MSEKKQIQFNLLKKTINEIKEFCKDSAYSMSSFVDFAIQEKLKREKKTNNEH